MCGPERVGEPWTGVSSDRFVRERGLSVLDALHEKDGEVLLSVRLQPKASRNGIELGADGRVKASVTAAPVNGAANKALVALVAKRMGIAKGAVRLVKGEKSREKTLGLRKITLAAVRERLGNE